MTASIRVDKISYGSYILGLQISILNIKVISVTITKRYKLTVTR
jgi:hypothetical protein